MSQTEKLFNMPALEDHITIGKDRIITVPNSLKRIAVQYDHNVETVTFDCPRFWDGLDMSEMTIYINYLCADRKSGCYRAENVAPDKYYIDMMHFDWTISRNISLVPGKIAFQVCVKKADEDGNEQIHWNSEINKDCFITESLNCDNTDVAELLPDLIEQWHRELMEMCESGEFDGPQGMSPTVQVIDIQGGHRIIITDVNGTQNFDVMDTYIDSSDAVSELMNRFVQITTVEPANGPAIWFDIDNEETESGTIKVKDRNGIIHTFYPNTFMENVSGLENIDNDVNTLKSYYENGVAKIQNGGTGASDAETARKNLGAADEDHGHEELDTLNSYFENGAASVSHGGTGASDAETARKNLGAAADNHTHDDFDEALKTLQSYFKDGGALMMSVQSCNDTDLNTLTTQGMYAGYTGMTNSAVNSISVIEVIPYSDDWVLQRQTVLSSEHNDYRIFVRYKYSGTTWSDWARMMTNIVSPEDRGDIPPAAGTPGRIFYKKVSS